MTFPGRTIDLPCDLLVVHDGIVPSTDLAHAAGLALEWKHDDASWRPQTTSDGRAELAPGPALTTGPCRIRVTGDARRIGGADAAIAHGRHAAGAILAELGQAAGKPATGRTGIDVQRALAARPSLMLRFRLA
ncbi:hypothetical protein P6U16_25470 (plasmid) [Rhizobium sp. 32-5/1]|uniref:hypothetical protein n=1 Tax=Rhizobium sp. 32-5/1 TaxID=3019602 RepID=UPI00240DCE6A|nr:hypothetical protein [Rhizobium sp. 32-5/1]WEZ85442.1 hypothetical protein P6U16_25470 [Rhizobium sp. 32-5/1]